MKRPVDHLVKFILYPSMAIGLYSNTLLWKAAYADDVMDKAGWTKEALAQMWKSAVNTDPGLICLIPRLCPDEKSSECIHKWLADFDSKEPNYAGRYVGGGFPPDIDETLKYPSMPREVLCRNADLTKTDKAKIANGGLPVAGQKLNTEAVGIQNFVFSKREELEAAFKGYLRNDKGSSDIARSVLTRMAGAAAVANLDSTILQHKDKSSESPTSR